VNTRDWPARLGDLLDQIAHVTARDLAYGTAAPCPQRVALQGKARLPPMCLAHLPDAPFEMLLDVQLDGVGAAAGFGLSGARLRALPALAGIDAFLQQPQRFGVAHAAFGQRYRRILAVRQLGGLLGTRTPVTSQKALAAGREDAEPKTRPIHDLAI
jgi:hypothetical protein